MLQFLCLQVCVYGGSAVPQEGVGSVTWRPSPRGWWGTVFPGVGNDKGGGGLILGFCALCSPFLHELTMKVVRASYGLVQATVGVGTVLIGAVL